MFEEELRAAQELFALSQRYAESGLGALVAAVEAVRQNPLLPGRALITLFTGDHVWVNMREEVGRSLYVLKSYDLPVSRFLLSTLRPGDVFFDVGAHLGYFSVLGARAVGPAGRVHAFEPVPGTAAWLRDNVQRLEQVVVEQLAIGDRETLVRIQDYGEDWSAFNSIFGARTGSGALEAVTSHEVPMTSIDAYCAERGLRPTLIKIDAESSEFLVLAGMTETLQDVRPSLVVEMGDFEHITSSGVPPSAELLRRIESFGYDLFEPTDGGLLPHVVGGGAYAYQNVVCLPRGNSRAA